MAAEQSTAPAPGLPWYLGPWAMMLAGVVAAFAGLLLSAFPGPVLTPLRVGLLVLGVLLAGAAVWRRMALGLPQWAADRLEPAALVAAAGGVALIASLALDVGNPREPLIDAVKDGPTDQPLFKAKEDDLPRYYNRNYDPGWDSIRLLLLVGVGVSLAGAGVVLLPWRARKVAFSLMVLFHFGGILTASASAPTSSGNYPWLPSQLWTYVYRPYLCFMYMNNAYHFYSPEPGPCTMLWFRVEFADGSARWVRLYDREGSSSRLEYQRLLAVTELVNQVEAQPTQKVGRLAQARQVAGIDQRIPMHPTADLNYQYRELNPLSKAYIASYARHLAKTVQHETDPSQEIKAIKVYRVTHDIIRPGLLARGMDPADPELYYIWFNGEFTLQGPAENRQWALRDHRQVPGWENLDQDPFLYWMIPVFRRVTNPEAPEEEQQAELVDCLKRHAGDSAIPAWDSWPTDPSRARDQGKPR